MHANRCEKKTHKREIYQNKNKSNINCEWIFRQCLKSIQIDAKHEKTISQTKVQSEEKHKLLGTIHLQESNNYLFILG